MSAELIVLSVGAAAAALILTRVLSLRADARGVARSTGRAAELLHAEAAALLAMLEADTSGYLVYLDRPIGGFAPSEEEQKVLDDKFRDLTEADVAAAVDWKRRVGLMRNHLELLA